MNMANERIVKKLGNLVTAFAVLHHRSVVYRLFPFDDDMEGIAKAKAEIKKLELLLKKRSSNRRRDSPKQSLRASRKANDGRRAKR